MEQIIFFLTNMARIIQISTNVFFNNKLGQDRQRFEICGMLQKQLFGKFWY